MGQYTAYPAYKDSGVAWLGEIPEGWEALPLKRLTRFAYGDSLPSEKRIDGDIDVFGSNGAVGKHDEANTQAPVIIIGRKGSFGKLIFSNRPGFAIDTTYFVDQTQTQNHLRWLYYAMSCLELDSQSKDSAVPGLSREEAYAKVTPLPPLPEQQTIALFLDHKTAQIDALIAKKEALLARLAEKRTALITRAVTQGLDPSVPMKDSGVTWLGEIPAHWDRCHVKRVAKVSYGVGGEIDRSLTEGTNLLSLPNETKNGTLLLDEVPFCELSESDKKTALLQKGDLLFNWRNGSSEHLGKTAYFDLDGEWTHVSFLLRLRFDYSRSDSRYFQYMLNSLRITGFFISSKAGVNNTFNLNELANLWIINPPQEEQQAIANYLDQHTAELDEMASKIQSAINTLKEYRTALITHAVTGKIDVRHVALPDEAAEVMHA